ncbi:VTT domain-containing protein [Cetobacterium somerae]|uniref:YqaA family protein n=1 Tax=Cetobacterium sp. NK01 TaxID=2993530 RepID=UPI0021161743|nr:VTT domain-containing protein [Cetobacterium sp. NK01]MCQ8213553.1 VTT domain-containing protein [Cetobacterium sp. NK01]
MFEILKNYGILGIAIAGLLEATILPIPMETISIPVYLSSEKNIPYLVVILIFFSTLGSAIGYFFWKELGRFIRDKYSQKKILIKLKKLYEKNIFLTILSSAFTPIPFEGYVMVAGILGINFKIFILGAIASRILRHLPQGIIVYFYGERILNNFKAYSIGIILIFICIFIIKKFNLLNKYSKKGNI